MLSLFSFSANLQFYFRILQARNVDNGFSEEESKFIPFNFLTYVISLLVISLYNINSIAHIELATGISLVCLIFPSLLLYEA